MTTITDLLKLPRYTGISGGHKDPDFDGKPVVFDEAYMRALHTLVHVPVMAWHEYIVNYPQSHSMSNEEAMCLICLAGDIFVRVEERNPSTRHDNDQLEFFQQILMTGVLLHQYISEGKLIFDGTDDQSANAD